MTLDRLIELLQAQKKILNSKHATKSKEGWVPVVEVRNPAGDLAYVESVQADFNEQTDRWVIQIN